MYINQWVMNLKPRHEYLFCYSAFKLCTCWFFFMWKLCLPFCEYISHYMKYVNHIGIFVDKSVHFKILKTYISLTQCFPGTYISNTPHISNVEHGFLFLFLCPGVVSVFSTFNLYIFLISFVDLWYGMHGVDYICTCICILQLFYLNKLISFVNCIC